MSEKSCITINCGCCGNDGEITVGNAYSLEETLCGIWIDGKTIYRKVYKLDGELLNNGLNCIDISDIFEEIDTVTNLRGYVHEGLTYNVLPLPFATITKGEYRSVSLYERPGEIAIRCEVPAYILSDAFVYLEYTKK
jgi:hypothetical protein|nr:MAG TPA: hypothetical protein [Caudoviricetes sp.]